MLLKNSYASNFMTINMLQGLHACSRNDTKHLHEESFKIRFLLLATVQR